ncbi:MAG: O-antigen ligase family protein [Blastocatellia bacterium]|nr:O-antigen ligase family protein [Blastocatellia bacterium]
MIRSNNLSSISSGLQKDWRSRLSKYLDQAALFSLFFFALAAPHSIAGSQGGFLAFALFWVLGCVAAKRWPLKRTPLDIPLMGLFCWAVLSTVFSYEPMISLKGLKGLAFLNAFLLVATRASEGRYAKKLVLTFMLSSLVNVGYTIVQKVGGEGLRIDEIAPKSRLIRMGFDVGDVIVKVDGQPVKSLNQLSTLVDSSPKEKVFKIDLRRGEMPLTVSMNCKRIKKVKTSTGVDRFGIKVSTARDSRARGFYNHYATYAEVLQWLASLYFGFLIAAPKRWKTLLAFGLGASAVTTALIFTATRAPLLGLGVSVVLMTIIAARGKRRLAIITLILIALPVGAFAISKWRGVGLIDSKDGSTTWRLQVWKEGIDLSLKDPIFGIGKGSERVHWREWGLYNHGELPPGHFHSTPLQIAVWWGIPAVIFYFWTMLKAIYELGKAIVKENEFKDWQRRGLLIGAFGGVAGFNFSALVHFNFGDGEVVMVLWLVLGLAFAEILIKENQAEEK